VEVRQVLGGRYKLLNELGSGGMAVVWRARDEVLGRPVAVKVLAARFAGDPQSRARIRDEARAAANLSHPNIAQVYDYGEASESGSPLPYVVMELINGPTLQQKVASGPLPPRKVFRICGEVAAALAVAHAEDLVHRDIKMANIMVTPSGAKVVDFGIAAAVGPAPEDMLVGTPAYLAPERLTGDAVVPASDVYALGVLLYRLLAGEAPWSVETTTQMLQAHVYVDPAPLPKLAGVPVAVAELINRCLGKDPGDRPTAGEVSSILADAAEASMAPSALRDDTLHRVPAVRAAEDLVAGGNVGAGTGTQRAGALDLGIGVDRGIAARNAEDPAGQTLLLSAGGTVAGDAEGRSPYRRGVAATPPGPPRRGGGGSSPVPLSKRKPLLIGGGIAAVVVVALLIWLLPGDGDADRREPSAAETASAAPIGGIGAVPAVSNNGGPRVSATPSGHPTAGSTGKAASAAPSGSVVPTAGIPAGPAAPSGSAAARPSASVSPATAGKRLTSPGGYVDATCANGKAALTGWKAADGFEVERVDAGPALTALIIFKGATQRYRMRVTCVGDQPTAFVLPL
jgi:hypothetical protein